MEAKKRPGRMKEEPRSLFDEQLKLATALSASMSSNERYALYVETFFPKNFNHVSITVYQDWITRVCKFLRNVSFVKRFRKE